jgi:hypothetical protein
MTSDNDGELLKDACDQVINDPDLAPEIGPDGRVLVTHCNAGALLTAQALACHEFDAEGEPLMADEMIALMERNESGKWSTGTSSETAIHALSGGLAFAAKTSAELEETHGHICTVYPASQQWSNSWKKDTVMVANVGKQNREEKASEAFPVLKGEPTFYIFTA